MTTIDERPSVPDEREWPDDADHRRRRLVVVIAVVVVVVVVLTWVVAFSSLLGVRSIDVRGETTVTATAIEAVADVPHGAPLARLDTDAIARRVEGLTAVESASVSTSFPSTVVIAVVERAAVGYVVQNGRSVLVDASGLQFRTVGSAPSELPKFSVPTGADARATGRAVATVAAALPAGLLTKVESIQALDPTAITLVLHSGRIVRWGTALSSAAKARVLPALLRYQRGQVHIIDVTDPARPFTR